MVVSAEEVATNPAFSLLKERDKNCINPSANRVYGNDSNSKLIHRRKASNCRSDSSLDSNQNNASVHQKKSKKGQFLKRD